MVILYSNIDIDYNFCINSSSISSANIPYIYIHYTVMELITTEYW